MKIFQPMLFVGLGGTGGLIGAELERRIRADLCGPDGNLITHITGQPHQLPDCLQFVYADFSDSDLERLPHRTVDPRLRPAYNRTSRSTYHLLPQYDSSPEVTQMLRAAMREETRGWLPPHDNEPRVTPLRNGAGQLPTVGRAALFGTLRHSLAPVLEPLTQAIDMIAGSNGQLDQLGGGGINGYDVFVAFSVAGGTGAGIFLDYLYLINQAFQEKGLHGVKIYPLVVMPSTFPAAAGGGREAELNSARALVDLFRVVDEQNAPRAGHDIGETGQDRALRITYPNNPQPMRLRTGILPTAFLFSGTAGIRQDDLRRSIVSLILSLIGTELGDGRPGVAARADDDYQTFAASFINRGLHRAAPADSGIGRQGVSTALVASMTAPLDDLAELIAGRLLRSAVNQLGDPNRRPGSQDPVALIKRMFADSGLEELWERKQLDVGEVDPLPKGGPAIERALSMRLRDMQVLLDDLRPRSADAAARMADRFLAGAGEAADKLLQTVDPFLLEQVVKGLPGADDPIAQLGFLGMLDSRSRVPVRSAAVKDQPPRIPRIKGRVPGIKARWGDEDVQAALRAQDAWYSWRSKAVWHEAWRDQQRRWQPAAEGLAADLNRLLNAFRQQAEQEPRSSEVRASELYEDRRGISYLLPPQGEINHFYEDLRARLAVREGLLKSDREAALALRLIDGNAWSAAFRDSRRAPAKAVADIKSLLVGRITRLFAEAGDQVEETPLLPSMGTLLSAAAGNAEAAAQVSQEAQNKFRTKLAGLLPAGFTPDGTGRLKALVVYPRVANSDDVEDYLARALRLPNDTRLTVEYRGVDTNAITVVQFRSEMSLTQVPEARKVLRQWAQAKDDEQAEDVLRWRQRLGHRDDWLVSGEEDRRTILHRLLCCLWNGQVEVLAGKPDSPRQVKLRLYPERGSDQPGVRLRLPEFDDDVSSWAELLRTYERWTVMDDERIVEEYCRRLMRAQPVGLNRSGSEPDPLFVQLVEEVAPRQLALLRERAERGGARAEGWVRPLWQFWARTLPAALDLEFADQRAVQPNLRSLLAAIRSGDLDPHRAEPAAGPGRRRAPRVDVEDEWSTDGPLDDRGRPDRAGADDDASDYRTAGPSRAPGAGYDPYRKGPQPEPEDHGAGFDDGPDLFDDFDDEL
ncbi:MULTISPECIES: tubulin-like doman-containing protein [Streptacidiphilus]|uniref:Tubulin-like doman-containing protein n=1 Tax=Streptacidiphilus cavernicola TaxID=3342716 RepID=A0ABV6ULW6_9ACTN|nr:tubulin-like doman-containing protein [Streptacidiphilus jeojiense]